MNFLKNNFIFKCPRFILNEIRGRASPEKFLFNKKHFIKI